MTVHLHSAIHSAGSRTRGDQRRPYLSLILARTNKSFHSLTISSTSPPHRSRPQLVNLPLKSIQIPEDIVTLRPRLSQALSRPRPCSHSLTVPSPPSLALGNLLQRSKALPARTSGVRTTAPTLRARTRRILERGTQTRAVEARALALASPRRGRRRCLAQAGGDASLRERRRGLRGRCSLQRTLPFPYTSRRRRRRCVLV